MKAISALRKATPEARQLAARLAPLYENWTGKSPLDRARMLVEVVNEQLRAAGTPEVTPALTKAGAGEDGLMKTETWDLFLNSRILEGHTQTPEQFAYACGVAMHEGYHAQQLFRAARTNPIMAKPRFDPGVFQAVVEANAGRRPAEKFGPTSLAYAEAAAVRESMWSTSGAANRKKAYARLEAADAALRKAVDNGIKVRREPRGSPIRDVAAKDLWAAKVEFERAHDDYMNLPEEVEAWKAGGAVEAAVSERLRLLTAARNRERAAWAAYLAAEKDYLHTPMEPRAASTIAAQHAFDVAFKEYRRALAMVKKLEQGRDFLAKGGKKP
jgi:hypothetical protein